MADDQEIIVARGLAKKYQQITALEGLDLTITRGELFGLLGPNGAGKTTTIKILTTLAKPTGGQAWRIQGFDVVRQPLAVKECIAVCPRKLIWIRN